MAINWLWADNTTGKVYTPASGGATILSVVTSTGSFPSPGSNQQFEIVINAVAGATNAETAIVTGNTSGTFTLSTGLIYSHSAGEPVALIIATPYLQTSNGFPLGLSGATAATRFVGATISGSPTSGTFLVGDWIIDQSGAIWICTGTGTPGTWVKVGGSSPPPPGPGYQWSNITPATSPTPRYGAAMCYDSANNLVVLFGGFVNPGWANDTWTFNGSVWTQQSPSTSPPITSDPQMVFDSSAGLCVLFEGNGPETWTYNTSTNTWTNKAPATQPPVNNIAGMSFDSTNGVTVLFTGTATVANTWTYAESTNTWTNKAPATQPPLRGSAGMSFDSTNGVTVLFGGAGASSYLNDTWTYAESTNTWTNKAPAAQPSSRQDVGMSFDSTNGVTVLFGGAPLSGYPASDTWTYAESTNTWTQLSPAQSPPARESPSQCYDSQLQETVLFGGYTNPSGGYPNTLVNDTWAISKQAPNPSMSNPMTFAGDMIVGGASGVPTRIGVGTANKIIGSNGTDPTWGSITSFGGAELSATQTFTGPNTFDDVVTSGATQTGYASGAAWGGANVSGAPTTGAHVLYEVAVDATGIIWVCTVAGTPGTWVNSGTAADAVTSVFGRTGAVAATSGDYTAAKVTNAADTSSATTQAFTAPVSTAGSATGYAAASTWGGANVSGAPTTGAHVKYEVAVDANGAVWICTTAGTPGTWTNAGSAGSPVSSVSNSDSTLTISPTTGAIVASLNLAHANTFTADQTAPALVASGLTGATAASRYVGATTSGAPTSGTFAVGDFVIDQTAAIWVCTVAGTSGTWVKVGGSGGGAGAILAYTNYAPATVQSFAVVNGTITVVSSANLKVTFTAPASGNVAVTAKFTLKDGTTAKDYGTVGWSTSSTGFTQIGSQEPWVSDSALTSTVQSVDMLQVITGLTSGTVYTLYLGAQAGLSTVADIQCMGASYPYSPFTAIVTAL